ncbi:asparaginase, partial [bacterium]|nr:asparaginase [bacterium]
MTDRAAGAARSAGTSAAAGNGVAGGAPFVPLVRLDRGGRAEVTMHGAVVVADDAGNVRAACGDPGVPTYLRSSVKMIQALPLVRSGAADAFALTPRHLAVCCASHSGEEKHTAAVREILAACGRSEDDLHCGPHPPFHRGSAEELIRRGEAPAAIHSDCSGKHAGMIAACVHRGWPVDGYWQGDHPLQEEIRATLARLAGIEPPPFAIDGCGVPTFYVPLGAFAFA